MRQVGLVNYASFYRITVDKTPPMLGLHILEVGCTHRVVCQLFIFPSIYQKNRNQKELKFMYGAVT